MLKDGRGWCMQWLVEPTKKGILLTSGVRRKKPSVQKREKLSGHNLAWPSKDLLYT